MILTLVLGLILNAIVLPIAAKRVLFLYRLITSGQPAPDRIDHVRERLPEAIKTQVTEVFGQKKLLKWSVPGAAHFFVFWAFLILASVYFEAYAVLVSRNPEWHWFIFNSWSVLGFVQDLISVLCLISLGVFTAIRIKNAPERLGRKSRFKGSHLSGAWITLFMIFNVIWTLFLFRGAVAAHDIAEGEGNGYGKAAFVSYLLGKVLPDSTALIGVGLLLHIGVMLVFLIFVLNSKHLHIFLAPLNVMFGRRPDALGGLKPLTINGQALTMEAMEDLEEDDFEKLGVGKVEDFTWKGMLDFSTCTECGRCQSQCPAWNTEKPLSPKLLIMGLRDHAFAKAPYLLADGEEAKANVSATALAEAERPLVGETEGDAWHPTGGAVIDPDVLWSCVNCGACVEQCPVDIEHIDHIDDMRRYQVLVESNFPSELNNIFKGLERKGNPWGMDPKGRMDWAKGLDFEVKQVGVDVESLDEVDWLFWVGCAGAFEDRQKKTTQAVAELLHMADVDFAVLGDGETCTGDPARRAGNEVIFMQLAAENAEVLKETKAKKVVSTCAHCFNTLKNEYAEFGVELEVVHHTQLLNRLVRDGKLKPIAPTTATVKNKTITYHDPCFLGRHNKVYEPPRELLSVIPNTEFKEMPRNSEMSFCCGGGGARMWMEEDLGTRININRTEEAVATGADQIAVGCPFCRVMLSDGLTAQQADGQAREEVEVLDVAQMLLASVKRDDDPATEAEPTAEDEADPDSISATAAAAPAADAAESGDSSDGKSGEELDEPAPTSKEADEEVAAKHNVAEDEDGGAVDTNEVVEKPAGEDAPAVEEVPEPEDSADDTADQAETDDRDASDKEDAAWANVGAVNTDLQGGGGDAEEKAEPETTPEPETSETTTEPETSETEADTDDTADQAEADDRAASEKEDAAWANVGPVNTDLQGGGSQDSEPDAQPDPEPDPSDVPGTPSADETEETEPAKADEDDAPAEEILNVPDESEPVEEGAREEEAGGITPVEDVTDETVVEDAAPPTGEGAKLSEAATGLAADEPDEGDEKKD